jgi:hypothetical protein
MVKRRTKEGHTIQWSKEEQKKDIQYNTQKKNKRTNNDLKALHIKLKISQREPHTNLGELVLFGRVGISFSTSGIRRDYGFHTWDTFEVPSFVSFYYFYCVCFRIVFIFIFLV